MVNGMKPSEIIQVTGGFFKVAPLSFTRRSENGAKKFFLMELLRKWGSWVALRSDGGRPSGMVSNRKSDKPSKELGPLNCKKTLVVELTVDKGNVKTFMVEKL